MKILVDDRLYLLDIEAAARLMPEQRLAKMMAFRHEDGRRQSAAAYMLLRKALLTEYGISASPEFAYTAGGKPYLPDYPAVHFNLSHCRHAAVCAVADFPVGIDVESVRPFKDRLARHVLSKGEYAAVVRSARPDVEFIRYWTMKESVLKLTGEGLRTDLRSVLPAAGVEFSTVVTPTYIYTVCRYKPR